MPISTIIEQRLVGTREIISQIEFMGLVPNWMPTVMSWGCRASPLSGADNLLPVTYRGVFDSSNWLLDGNRIVAISQGSTVVSVPFRLDEQSAAQSGFLVSWERFERVAQATDIRKKIQGLTLKFDRAQTDQERNDIRNRAQSEVDVFLTLGLRIIR